MILSRFSWRVRRAIAQPDNNNDIASAATNNTSYRAQAETTSAISMHPTLGKYQHIIVMRTAIPDIYWVKSVSALTENNRRQRDRLF
jgi:hypothetical protein